jgi:hypothetical protein
VKKKAKKSRIPNAETIKALEESKHPKKLSTFKNFHAVRKHLNV